MTEEKFYKKGEGLSPGEEYSHTAREIAESLHAPDSFQQVEIHSKIRPGLEIPLMGIPSIADTTEEIYDNRQQWLSFYEKYLKDLEDFNSFVKEVEQSLVLTEPQKKALVTSAKKRVLTPSKRARYGMSVNMQRSMNTHFLQLSMALEGKRAEQGVSNIAAIVNAEKDILEQLIPKKPSIRERFHLGK